MRASFEYLRSVGGEAPVIEFAALVPTPGNAFPDGLVRDYITLGPFVLETKGTFETEYLYERHRTLDCDYLAASGGEAGARPFLGKSEPNEYWGPANLTWERGNVNTWGTLRMGGRGTFEDNNDALYVTPQRNCVFYAAFYVRSHGDNEAVICYESSGSLVYVNGELADYHPYGRVKSLSTLGNLFRARFHDGINTVLIKIRTGYIADGIDFCLSRLSIHPVAAGTEALRVTYPAPTGAYLGTIEAPRQVFYMFAASGTGSDGGRLLWRAEGHEGSAEIPPLKAGECTALRVDVPSGGEPAVVPVKGELEQGGASVPFDFRVETTPCPEFAGTEHIFTDFHFDTTYHEEQRTYAFGAFDITRNMLARHRADHGYKLTLSEIDYLHPYYSIFPADRALIDESFRDGTIEADCFYNQPNDLTLSGEALVRNMVYGQKYHKEYLGQEKLIFAPGDVYGHPFQISQICAKGEVPSMRWLKCIVGLDSAFCHMAPDGTSILHLKSMEVKDAIRLHLNHCVDSSSRVGLLPAYPADLGLSWMRDTVNHSHYSVFSELNEGLEADDLAWKEKTGRPALQTISRDLTQHHSGTLLTRSDFKQANRLAENRLVTAEKLATIAALYGADYPEKTLDKGWRQVLCAQHHDSITGTNNEISFVDLMIEYREAVRLAQEVVDGAMAMLLKAARTPAGHLALLAFNPHPWQRREAIPVRLAQTASYTAVDMEGNEFPLVFDRSTPDGGAVMVFTADLPALGYKTFALKEGGAFAPPLYDEGCTIENEHFVLKVDPARGGGITSIWDKEACREVCAGGVDGPANRVVALREVPNRRETQHEFYTTGQKLFSDGFAAQVTRTVTEEYQRLEITCKMDTVARVRQTLTLRRDAYRIDMDTVIEDYIDRDDLFCVTFPVNVSGGRLIYDDRFSPHVAGKSVRKLSFQTHQYYSYSHCRVVPSVQWAELGPTIAMRSGKKALQIGMTALIRDEHKGLPEAADRLLEALTRKFIPVTLYPEGRITDIDVTDRIAQHPTSVYGSAYGDWRLPHFNEDLTNTDTRFVLSLESEETGEYAAKILARLDEAQREALRKALEGSGTALVYCVDSDNALKKPIDVVLVRARDAETLDRWVSSVAEHLEKGRYFPLDGAVCLDELPDEDDYGVALINCGNIACSVEGENMLSMMLFHTADFYGNMGRTTGGEQLIPEQKTFSASYALYPHRGSYREADVYRRAMEFNDPFVAAVSETTGAGLIPARKSFLETSGSFIMTCFKAGGFDMAGLSQKMRTLAERGITLRGFETDGLAREIRVESGFGIRAAEKVNLLEHAPAPLECASSGFADRIGGASIETYRLTPETEGLLRGCPAREREEVQPVYVRTWEHDLGSMPMGYFAVVGTIDRRINEIDQDRLELTVNMVNNQPDARAQGVMRLAATDGLALSVAEIPYVIAPRGYLSHRVIVTKRDGIERGIVELLYEDDGQTFRDAYELGTFEPWLRLTDNGDRITATVTNETDAALTGQIALATPIETWDEAANPNALASVEMGPFAVNLAPGEVRDYDFAVSVPEDGVKRSFWAICKLMINGHLYFGYIHRKSAHHAKWSDEFTIDVFRENGSQRLLYEE